MSEEKKENEKKEEECRCYAKSRTEKTCPPPIKNVTHPLRYYEFTQDEIKALEECDKESFYRRCLPFSTLFATATYAAIKTGYLKRNPHFGVVPKVMLAVFAGHVVGRLSNSPRCDERLRALPANSKLGELWRDYYEASQEQPPGAKPKDKPKPKRRC